MIYTLNCGANYQNADNLHLIGGVESYRTALPEEIATFKRFKVSTMLAGSDEWFIDHAVYFPVAPESDGKGRVWPNTKFLWQPMEDLPVTSFVMPPGRVP